MINDNLSTKLKVRPLGDKETVTYRLIGAGEPSLYKRDEQDRPVPNMPTKLLEGRDYIIDPFNKEGNNKILIENTNGGRYIEKDDGSRFWKPTVEKIKIVGSITVNKNDFEKYCFLERSNKNKSNIYRNKAVKPMFERVTQEKHTRDEAFKYDMIDMAIRIVKEGDMADLRFLAKNLPEIYKSRVNFDDVELAKVTLRKIAQDDPEAIIMGGNDKKDANVKLARKIIQLEQAEEWHAIKFDESERKWFFNEEGDYALICHVFPGTNRYQGLLDHLHKNEENQKIFRKIQSELEKVKEAVV